MKLLQNRMLWLGLAFLLISNVVFAGGNTEKKHSRRSQQPLEIKVVPWGPTQAEINAAQVRIEQTAAVRNELKGVKYRQVGFEYLDGEGTDKSLPSVPPTRFRVTFYDYTNDRAVIAESDFAGQEAVILRTELSDPGVGGDELQAAYQLVQNDSTFADLAKTGAIEYDAAMPPVSNLNGERLVNVTVKNKTDGSYQIVGVSFKNDNIVRYENNAPPTSRVTEASCGIPSAGQGSTGPGVAGQYQMTILQDGTRTPLWQMLVVRPSASSGASSERSGIEIRDVKYLGKSVLKRGHAPILNVKYINDTCGPYRDWQYSEGYFNAPAEGATYPNGVGGGIAVLAAGQVATTAVESRNDAGNFQGVAIYQQDVGNGPEVVLVTEMNAGWYRYVMEWRFAADGTIRPRYGFGSTTSGCVCNPRNHHVYWRFDFDIVNPTNKIFKIERGRKFQTPVTTEAAIFRSSQLKRGFLIQNSTGDEAYQITPSPNDGSVANSSGVLTDTYGAGDFWLMQYKGTPGSPGELDDPGSGSAANLAPWINGESLVNQDLVVWYAAHQYRTDDSSRNGQRPEVISGVHVVGPDLRPVRW
ncbi:MAG: hypothetical protein M3T96_03485 [Acidobacteriota bacterium]|nr:hypothetical protein [Acidobacteriota bacterium]